MTPAASSQRYDHIDAMRAIAALLVVWLHVGQDVVVQTGGWLADFAVDANVGGIGVMLFFMISGFVIPASLRPGEPRGDELRRFLIRRVFRLYPAYWLSMLVALAGVWWLWGEQADALTIVANLTMAPQPFGLEPLQGLYWTLLTELVFYILCAGLFALGWLHRPGVLATAGLLLAALFITSYLNGARDPDNPIGFVYYTGMPMHLSLMFASALLRQWHDGALQPGPVRSALLSVFGLWAIVVAWLSAAMQPGGGLVWHYVDVEGSRAVGVLLFVVMCFWLKPTWPPLVALGRASYSLYLLHRPLTAMLLWLAAAWPVLAWLHRDMLAALGVVLAIEVLAAGLSYRFVELPMIALGRRLSRPASARAPHGPLAC